jgi:hypothetical protein
MDYKELTAPCGLDCFNCPMHELNITEQTAKGYAAATKIPVEKVPCKGCRASSGFRLHYTRCETLDCVKAKGLDFCYECAEFPCVKLCPAADGADRYPHNTKLYNLCRIKLLGLDEWAREAAGNKIKYFKGKFVPGVGPVIE